MSGYLQIIWPMKKSLIHSAMDDCAKDDGRNFLPRCNGSLIESL